MALDRSGIAKARQGASTLKNLSSSLEKAGTELGTIIKSDGNYQFFRTGTDKGFSVDEDLNDVVKIIVDQLKPQISALSNAIETFCNNQEALNRLEEMNQQREAEEASTKPFDSPDNGGSSFY